MDLGAAELFCKVKSSAPHRSRMGGQPSIEIDSPLNVSAGFIRAGNKAQWSRGGSFRPPSSAPLHILLSGRPEFGPSIEPMNAILKFFFLTLGAPVISLTATCLGDPLGPNNRCTNSDDTQRTEQLQTSVLPLCKLTPTVQNSRSLSVAVGFHDHALANGGSPGGELDAENRFLKTSG